MRKYGVAGESLKAYELVHLIPLELAGAPDDPGDLWPQPRTGVWNADLKDDLERTLNRRVCQGRMTLVEAQDAVRTNWIDAYRRYESGRARGNQ